MADINYISPSSLIPDFGKVSNPGLAGWQQVDQMNDYRDTMDLQKFLSGIGAQKAQLSLEEQIRDLPLKEAQRIRDIQDAGLTTQYAPELKELFVRDRRRTDQKETETLPSSIEATIAGNREKTNKSQTDLFDNKLNSVLSLQGILEQSGDDPAAKALVLQHAAELGIDPNSQLYQYLAKAGDPIDLANRLKGIEGHFRKRKDSIYQSETKLATQNDQLTAKLESARQLLAMKNAGQLDVQALRNMGAVEVAQINARARQAAARVGNQTLNQLAAEAMKNGNPTLARQAMEAMAKAKAAGTTTPMATFLAMQEINKLPEKERTPEAMAAAFEKHLNKFNSMEEMFKGQFTAAPTTGGPIGHQPMWQAMPTDPSLDAQSTNPAAPPNTPTWMMPGATMTPGANSNQNALPGAMGGLTPENEQLVLNDLLQELKNMPQNHPNRPRLIQAIEEQVRRAQTQGSAPPAAAAPVAPAGPANNPINQKFQEFMKNRTKTNEVPR